MNVLTFQSIVEKKGCLLISSTPSGPAPGKGNDTVLSSGGIVSFYRSLYSIYCAGMTGGRVKAVLHL